MTECTSHNDTYGVILCATCTPSNTKYMGACCRTMSVVKPDPWCFVRGDHVVIHLLLCRPQVTLAAWQEFDSQQEAVREFVNKARAASDRDLNFSSPESLGAELSQARVSGTDHFLCITLSMTLTTLYRPEYHKVQLIIFFRTNCW